MSFGASPADIIAVVTLCKTLYRECRAAGGEYDEISHEVRSLHTVLRHLKYEVEAPKSPLNRDRSMWTQRLAPTIADCDSTLQQLDALVLKYGSKRGASGSGKPKIGSNEMDQLGAIRVKLISQKRSLTAFLDSIQLPPSTMTSNLDNTDGQLDILLDKVDVIAARLGQRHEDGNKEAWKQFRRELIAEGFSSEVLQQNEDVLRAYIREMDQEGLLDNPPSEDIIPPHPAGPPTNRRPDATQLSLPEARPASFPIQQIQREDTGTKEMLAREDNMKFPPSMKFERRKPESRTEGTAQPRAEMTQIAKSPPSDAKNHYYINTDGTSDEEDDSDCSLERPKSPTDGEVINTVELIALSQALTIRPPGAPGSFNAGSIVDNQAGPPIVHRPRMLENGVVHSHPGAMPIPAPNPQPNVYLSTSPLPNAPLQDRLSTSPRPGATQLAPDEKGNTIKPDALWTKIDRRLVSPEVLAQDGRRYEARPEFVAVLGVLPRSEIRSLAARSAALRSARRPHADHSHAHHPPYHPHHHHPAPTPHSQPHSPQHPRPSTFPRSIPTPRHSTSDSDQGHTSSESEHPRQPHHKDLKPPRSILKNAKAPNYTHSQTPQSPVQSPGWASESRSRNDFGRSSRDGFYHSDEYDRDYDREYDRDHRERERERAREREEREREREREARKKDRRERDRERERERDKEKDKEKDKKKGFKIGHREVTAAGIGGAAMSLLTVLTEAAQGI